MADLRARLSISGRSRNLDEAEQIEAELSLIERQLRIEEEEVGRLQRILSQAEEVKENTSPKQEPSPPRKEPSPPLAPSLVVQATTLVRSRNRPATGWNVTDAEPEARAKERRREHDELTAELVHMARRLKLNNVALRDLVEQDKPVAIHRVTYVCR